MAPMIAGAVIVGNLISIVGGGVNVEVEVIASPGHTPEHAMHMPPIA